MLFINLLCLILLEANKIIDEQFKTTTPIESYKAKKLKISPKNKFIYQCNSFIEISLTSQVHVQCNDTFDLYIDYFQFLYYDFSIINNFVRIQNISVFDKSVDDLSAIIASIHFVGECYLIFRDFLNISIPSEFAEMLSYMPVWMTFTWTNYIKSSLYCIWDVSTFFNETKHMKEYFDSIESNTQWKKFCYNGAGFYLYTDKLSKEIIPFSSSASWAIVSSIIVVSVLMIISFYFIGFYRFKKYN